MKRFGVDVALTHAVASAVVGLAWWRLAPSLTYEVFEGRAYVLDETQSARVFGGDAWFVLLAAGAGLLCASVLLRRRHRGPLLSIGVAVGGLVGSAAAWLLAVDLGPGRVDVLAAAAATGEVQAGPELNAHAVLLVWPIVAVAVVMLAAAFSEPERSRPRSMPVSGE